MPCSFQSLDALPRGKVSQQLQGAQFFSSSPTATILGLWPGEAQATGRLMGGMLQLPGALALAARNFHLQHSCRPLLPKKKKKNLTQGGKRNELSGIS